MSSYQPINEPKAIPGALSPWSASASTFTEKYQIFGTDAQVLQVTLQPGEKLISQPGAMIYKAEKIKMKTSCGGCFSCCSRVLGGESVFQNGYVNESNVPACVSVTPDFPAKIVPIDLSKTGTVLASPGVYLCGLGDVKVSFSVVRNIGAGCFGGNGFLVLQLSGTGMVFLNGGGSVLEKVLAPGEVILVDTHSSLAFSKTTDYGLQMVNSSCLSWCFGGEGCFNTKITGPGLVIVQSMPLKRMRAAVAGVPKTQAQSKATENPRVQPV